MPLDEFTAHAIEQDGRVVATGTRASCMSSTLTPGPSPIPSPLLAGAWISVAILSIANAVVLFDRIQAEERLLSASIAYRRVFGNRARFIPHVS